jgi:hypothetical protein
VCLRGEDKSPPVSCMHVGITFFFRQKSSASSILVAEGLKTVERDLGSVRGPPVDEPRLNRSTSYLPYTVGPRR